MLESLAFLSSKKIRCVNTTSMICKQITLLIICCVAFVLLAASCGGSKWIVSSSSNSWQGLWKVCLFYQCTNELDTRDELETERVFCLLAVLTSLIAMLTSFLRLCTGRVKGFVSSALLIASVVSMVVALVLFTEEYRMDTAVINGKWGWSYYSGWVGCSISIIGAILGIFTSSNDYERLWYR